MKEVDDCGSVSGRSVAEVDNGAWMTVGLFLEVDMVGQFLEVL